MYVATPPAAAPADSTPAGRIPLPLARITTRSLPAGRTFGAGALRIIADLADAYGLPHDHEQYAAKERTTFTDLVKLLVDDLTNVDDPIGLVVLAHGFADAEPQWPACYLSSVLPGEPLSFAVADHGIVTPFLALRIAAEYIGADRLRRAVVIVLDQTSLLTDPAADESELVPAENRVVALEFAQAGAIGQVSVSIATDAAPESAARAWGDMRDGVAQPALVLGARLAEVSSIPSADPGVMKARAELPCGGPWLALAQGLDGWRSAGTRRVALMDYDPSMRLLGRCEIELLSS